MSSPMTQEQRYIKMTETPISRLIPSLAIPTIISMLVTSIYNMADTFFVSQISAPRPFPVPPIASIPLHPRPRSHGCRFAQWG